jgi:hypothetical protein
VNLSRMAFGHVSAQLIYAAVRLGVPDALAGGPLPPAKLADRTGCDPGGLTRLLHALIVLRLVEESPDGHVELAEAARPLCADHPRSMRSSVLLLGDPAIWRAWGAFSEAVRTGSAAFDLAHGRPLFDHLADDPVLSEIFNSAMGDDTGALGPAVARAHDFTGAGTVVDIGGGNGALLRAILAAAPGARGILFDTATGSAEAPASAGPPGRWSVRAGDFFAAVPSGDVLLLKGILHDWDDQRCLTLLRNCRAAIAPDGRLLVLEPVVPDRVDPVAAAGVVLSDIAMLVHTGGRERSRDEFECLFAAAGFALSAISRPLPGSPIHILVANPL